MEPQPTPQKETVAVSASFQTETFERVVSENRARIYRFLLSSSRDPALAETLTQECFLRAYRNWSGFGSETQVSTRLIRIAVKLQKNYWRKEAIKFWRRKRENSSVLDDILQSVPANKDSPATSATTKEQVALIWNTLASFSEKERTVFLLRVVEELSLTEIVAATGMRLSTVRTTLGRSVSKLRKAFLRLRKGDRQQAPPYST